MLMCPKADKGASSGHLIARVFVIRIWLLVVGKMEQTCGLRVSPRGKTSPLAETKVNKTQPQGWLARLCARRRSSNYLGTGLARGPHQGSCPQGGFAHTLHNHTLLPPLRGQTHQ